MSLNGPTPSLPYVYVITILISFNLELPYTKACIDPCSASWSLGGEEVQELHTYILVVARVRVQQS